MKTNPTVRLGGGLLALGGLTGAAAHLLHPLPPDGAAHIAAYVHQTVPAHLLLMTAVLLVMLGLPSATAAQGGRALAAVGHLFLFLGVALGDLLHAPIEFGVMPAMLRVGQSQALATGIEAAYGSGPLAQVQGFGMPAVLVGCMLYAIATFRAGVLPRWPAVLLLLFPVFGIAGMAGLAFVPPAMPTLYAALGAYGLVVAAGWRRPQPLVAAPAPVVHEREPEAALV
jgi:hypothetical protein